MPGTDPLSELRERLDEAVADVLGGAPLGTEPTLERPPRPEMGDYSTNAAMIASGGLGEPPREVAARIAAALEKRLGPDLEQVEIAGPGFVNLRLGDRWHREAAAAVLGLGDEIARPLAARIERVNVEFVSANPTGPLTLAGGRHAAYGEAVARLLEARGHSVEREYYLNDAGGQVDRFAASIAARIRGEEPPEDGYRGDYVTELARELEGTEGAGGDPDDLEGLARAGVEAMRERIAATLERFGVGFDTWFSERSLYESGAVGRALDELREAGHVYESEGAVWLRTSDLGDDKDRVLVRKDGEPTYFAADIAYHRDKLERGAERLINVLGADHHGYVPRLRAAIEALGTPGDRFEPLVMQMVSVLEGGKRAEMSKRRGVFVTLDDLLDEIGPDATRFFMLARSHDSNADIDVELAREQSSENPVYYVQYAHARIASLLRRAAEAREDGPTDQEAGSPEALAAPLEQSERALVKRLLELPDEIREAADRRAPHRLCAYAMATAADFHAFYRDCQVVGAAPGLQAARLGLCRATGTTIAQTLALLGVSAPERM